MPKIRVSTRILPVMIGTAGHVDHGKTALVRNLTGCETDRLAEEKQRGLSINLGFAACRFPGRRLAGVVDVPGHETFIRNMVAGAASMDIVMLVVAADDGVMPQTVEHMQIVKLLRTPRVLAVLTKVDLVDVDLLEMVEQDVAEFLARMGFPDAPIVRVSNESLEGLGEVRQTLEKMIADVHERQPSDRTFRMNVERAFSSKGYGTVVTGIPSAGAVHVGEDLELLPAGVKTGIRFIQSYQLEAEQVEANVCGALNLRNVDLGRVVRGMTLATPGIFMPTDAVIVQFRNVSEVHTLKRRTEVRFHTGTSVVPGVCRLIDCDSVEPGGHALAQVALHERIVVAAGDTYILRVPAPGDTVGGGVVLSARGRTRLNWKSSHVRARLESAVAAAERGDVLMCELLLGESPFVKAREVERLTQLVPEAARERVREKESSGELVDLGDGIFLVAARIDDVTGQARAALRKYHEENRHSLGMNALQIGTVLDVGTSVFRRLSEVLTRDPELVIRNDRLALASFAPRLTQQQEKHKRDVLERIRAGGERPPARGDLMRDLGISEADMRLLSQVLAEENAVKVVRTNLLLYSLFIDFRDKLIGLFADRDVVDIAMFRTATGVSRNMAESLLEAYDAEGYTRRVAEGRVLLRKPAELEARDEGKPA